jgi:prepilin-type N-terminal cleavage/methylation domain-containing protein/prepilin-type processing-associated H-X9-DG protein
MRKAFTLIELLVVIAIIAILAAILFPVFAQAKEAAKKTQDLSNQKNVATATFMYQSDVDDTFPRHVYGAPNRNLSGWDAPITWRDAIMPYVKNGNAKWGPGGAVDIAVGGIFETPAKPGGRNAYGFNRTLTPGQCYWNGNWSCDASATGVINPSVGIFPSVSATALDAPANTATTYTVGVNPDWNAGGDYTDSGWWWMGGAQWPPVFTGPTSHEKWDADSNVFPSYSIARYRYSKGMNTGFADGHAKFVKKGAFNWCRFLHVKGLSTDAPTGGSTPDNWDWLFESWAPCAPFAR